MSVQAGPVTVEQFLQLRPSTEGHYELRHGEVVLLPPPKWNHTILQWLILKALVRLLGDRGVVLSEMPFRPTPEHELWVADVAFVAAERASGYGDGYLMGAPDLVVEVLSPGNTVDEVNDKMAVCLENGCLSFWVVDPKRERLSLTEGDLTKHYDSSASFSCAVLGTTVPVRDLFPQKA